MTQTIAVLGTGIMGAPMARNLAGAGFAVRAWNRTRAKAEPLAAAGVTVAGSAAEAAEGADVVLTMLLDADAVRAAAADALGAAGEGAVWAQMSTVGVEAGDTLGALAADSGVAYVDAPVLGTKAPAEQGKLVVLASGPEDVRDGLATVFDALGTKTVWAGAAGAGQRLKLVANAWVLALLNGLAESVALAEGLDLDPQLFFDAIAGGPTDAGYVGVKGPMMVGRDYDDVSFQLSGAAKDARLIGEAAGSAGVGLRVAAAVREQLAAAEAGGHGGEDMAAVVEVPRGG